MRCHKQSHRLLSLLLCLLMVLSLFPTTVFAAEELPGWEASATEQQKVDWPVAPGTKIVKAGMAGPDPLTNVGLSFIGHFVDENGRTVLKGKYTQEQTVTSAVWEHIAFKFDEDLYNKIDFSQSFMMNKDQSGSDLFSNATFIGSHEKVVPFNTQSSGPQRRDFYFVLKEGVTWNDVIANGGHIVQARIYDDTGTRLWSKHSSYYKDLDAQVNYSTYTHAFTINGMIEYREALVSGRFTGSDNEVDSAGMRTVFYPDEGIFRVIYQYTHAALNGGTSYYKAFRQGFSNDFKQYLTADDTGAIAHLYIKDHAFNAYSTPIKKLPVKWEDLNTGGASSYFVAADSSFVVPNAAYKVVRAASREADEYLYSPGGTSNPTVTIVDYHVDVQKLQESAFAGDDLATAFAFDSAYLEDSKEVSYFQHTPATELVIPTGSTVEINYNKTYLATNHYQHHANVLFGENPALDLVYGVSNTENVGTVTAPKGMKYTVDKGFTLAANTPITIVNLEDNLSDRTAVGLVIKDPSGQELLNVNALKQADTFYETEIVPNSDVLGGGIVHKTAAPIVDEIFTDSTAITGLSRRPNTWVYATYVDGTEQKVFSYDDENLVPDGTADDEKHALTVVDDATQFESKTVSGRTYNGYPYAFAAIHYQDLQKDMPIAFAAVNLSTVRSDRVIEQVQAKVIFDLNGGQIGDSTDPIEKIAPLNENYSYDSETGQPNPAYVANGFEGPHLRMVEGALADHNGVALTGDELVKRQFPTEAPVKGTDQFLGWSTKKLTTEEEIAAFANAAALTDAANWADVDAGTTVYRFTATSPIDKARTVYAVYGALPAIIEVVPKDPEQPFNPENPDDANNSQTTPDGYVRVIFDAGEGGTFGQYAGGQAKVKVAYDVKADQTWAVVTAPVVTANVGYEAKAGAELWSPELPAGTETVTAGTYTAQYTKLDDVIPGTDDNGDPVEKPDGYVTVTFAKGDHGTLTGVSTYYVNPEAANVTVTAPTVTADTGYTFTGWDPAVATSYTQDVTHTAQYSAAATESDADKYDPRGQEITVKKGEEPKAADGIANKEDLPDDAGYTWKETVDTSEPGEKTGTVVVTYPDGTTDEVTVTVTVLADVIPVDPDDPGEQPEGYVTVRFNPGDGSWKDATQPSSYYVRSDAAVTPADFQAVTDNLEAPEHQKFSKWDGFPEDGKFTQDTELTATYVDDRAIIEVVPKDPEQPFNPENPDDANNSQTTPDGYVRVIFDAGEGGTFGQYAGGQAKVKVAYDVKADQTWAVVTAPVVTANVGYEAKAGAELWSPELPAGTETVTAGTYTAQYTKLDDVIPGTDDNGDPVEKPDGYVTVTFAKGDHGTLTGVSTYYVNPEAANVTVTAPTVTADTGYTFTGWDPAVATSYTQDTTHTAQYRKSGGSGGGGGGRTPRYTLSYESNGGTEYKDERYTEGSVVRLDKEPVREGFTFTGWYSDKQLTDPISKITMNGNKTIYAGWEQASSGLHIPDVLNGDDHFAYVAGYTDGTVRPLNNITRAEVAMIFYRLLKEDVRTANQTDSNTFADVTEDMWCNTAISTIARLGIVKGRSTTEFDPDAPITRAEFATICARFDQSDVASSGTFSDIGDCWAKDYIERAAALGWAKGYSDGTFRPNNHITRAEAMCIINRVLGRLPATADDLLPGMKTWPDNPESAWYYLHVQEATNSHSFERKADGVHETWEALLETAVDNQ